MVSGVAMPIRPAVSLRPALPRFAGTAAALAGAPPADTFQKGTVRYAAHTGESDNTDGRRLKVLLDDLGFMDRKTAAAYFLQKAVGINHAHGILDPYKLDDTVKADLIDLADSVQAMHDEDKVKFVRDLLGADSKYTRYVEAALIGEDKPGFRDTLKLLVPPKPAENSLSGYREAFSAMGLGLLMLPVVLSGKILFNPALAGHYLAVLGLALV